MSIPVSPRALAGLSVLTLFLACGGGAKPTERAASSPVPTPKPQVPAEPFWTSDSPERPHRARALAFSPATGAPLQLSEAEVARLGESREEAPRAAAPEVPAATPLRIVTGLRSFTYHQENATTLQPLDLTAAVIQALVPTRGAGSTPWRGSATPMAPSASPTCRWGTTGSASDPPMCGPPWTMWSGCWMPTGGPTWPIPAAPPPWP